MECEADCIYLSGVNVYDVCACVYVGLLSYSLYMPWCLGTGVTLSLLNRNIILNYFSLFSYRNRSLGEVLGDQVKCYIFNCDS